MYNFRRTFDLEKKSVFLINFLLVLIVILFLLFKISLAYFFYFDILLTFFLSYIFFKRSKKLAKMLIVTNIFIFFYFLYPVIAEFLSELLGEQSYVYIVFYNILVAYLFLFFSGYHKEFLGNFRKFSLKIFSVILLLGIALGFLFYLVKEPVPSLFVTFQNNGSFFNIFGFLLVSSSMVALSEQMIFSGFLFNVYKNLTTKRDAFFQVSIIFVMFHLLRFRVLVDHYYSFFNNYYLLYISVYYLLLFVFMLTALYLYSFKSKRYEGNFLYPVILHLVTDLSLFIFYIL